MMKAECGIEKMLRNFQLVVQKNFDVIHVSFEQIKISKKQT